MIISPPFLPESGLTSDDKSKTDPMMDAVDEFELAHGIYPVAADRSWHCGVHLAPDMHGAVYAIADGEVVAYRVCQHAINSGSGNAGFILLKHSTETGDGRTLTFYSLYMHLMSLAEAHKLGHNGSGLADFLQKPSGADAKGQVTPAAKGSGQRVRRKDILGYVGQYQGVKYLHFETFMLPGDFEAYFGHTQLGNAAPVTPTTSDCWGHTYYTIPKRQTFLALPLQTGADHKLHGIEFNPGQPGPNELPLAVETYFSKGTKYTNVWSVADDGTRTLLTPEPVPEADYEYDLYKRATALYSACPSDGYEMLRFGRVLSSNTTQPTWVKVTYAVGKQGYIDISKAAIQKLSDADFPSFMGWQKITDGNTPFGSDGLCDIDALRKLLKDEADSPHEQTVVKETAEVWKANELSAYVRGHEQVRKALRGFICNAPSEWDSTDNETRWAKLLDKDGFYEGNEPGYQDFLKYLKEIQFWDVTGLPAGQKLWFFHPLAFIRQFRRCGWLNKGELSQIYDESNYTALGKTGEEYREHYRNAINMVFRKYRICDPIRSAHFFGQSAIESAHMMVVRECSVAISTAIKTNHVSIMPELNGYLRSPPAAAKDVAYFAKYDGNIGLGNTDAGDGVKFRGRGFKQLTGRYNYAEYWVYRGWLDRNSYDHAWFKKKEGGHFKAGPKVDNPEILGNDVYSCVDAAGFFCVHTALEKAADKGVSESSSRAVTKIVNPYDVKSPPLRWNETKKAYQVLGDQL
ncbi:M23 family metallopeptidase [Paraburkholderia sp. CNPSo 3274]|uniref:M23 family metallopeptidase n=1 Tax=Paraburkholderia sp. CNPSo 3274 TaxID=2940932 RepID=UPI0020B71FBD|nr:M23 family metallopeptidase [Paraburkholderia sp. CNPSo 3274]MCP3712545.1 M23 family metallopeptidase [Paraburkholderia sp. CNPSo 3274]